MSSSSFGTPTHTSLDVVRVSHPLHYDSHTRTSSRSLPSPHSTASHHVSLCVCLSSHVQSPACPWTLILCLCLPSAGDYECAPALLVIGFVVGFWFCFETRSHIVQGGHKCVIILPPISKCYVMTGLCYHTWLLLIFQIQNAVTYLPITLLWLVLETDCILCKVKTTSVYEYSCKDSNCRNFEISVSEYTFVNFINLSCCLLGFTGPVL